MYAVGSVYSSDNIIKDFELLHGGKENGRGGFNIAFVVTTSH